MSAVVIGSYVLLWLIVGVMAVGFIALARQIALLYGRLPQNGARLQSTGPDLGETLEVVDTFDVAGRSLRVPAPSYRHTLLVVLSTSCSVCDGLAPAIRGIASSEKDLAIVLFSYAGSVDENRLKLESLGLSAFPHLHSQELARRFSLVVTPYALIVTREGTVAAKGLVTNREQLDSLLTAIDLNVESIQRLHPRERSVATA